MKVTLEKIEKIIVPECDGAYIKRRRINDEREFTLVFPKPKKAHLNKEREQHIFTIATNFLGEQIVHTFDETICSTLDEKEKKQLSEEELRSETRCPICFTDFVLPNMDEDQKKKCVKPIQLKCTHALCRECLMEIRGQKPDEIPSCPVCRKSDSAIYNLLDDPPLKENQGDCKTEIASS